jgi:hypothetical protein
MFAALFGNENIVRTLIFLFVNGKCYGAQLHRALQSPLTPIQKALLRLEKGGVVTSYYEGKTRVYRFNPGFSLLAELEQLLKKMYTLLSAEEKKVYYHKEEAAIASKSSLRALQEFWSRLSTVTEVSFHAQSRQKQGWNGRGKGTVKVTREGNQIIFQDEGSGRGIDQKETNYRTAYRWTFDRIAGVIALEHVRRGLDHPVFLFHLAPTSKYTLASVDSHLCEADTYFGQVQFDPESLKLKWRVIGPNKNEEIFCSYV